MGGFGGGGGGAWRPRTSGNAGPLTGVPATQAASAITGISSEFGNDGAIRMPVYNSPAQLEAARIASNAITARSGRGSTALVPGTGTYAASFLGSVPGAAK